MNKVKKITLFLICIPLVFQFHFQIQEFSEKLSFYSKIFFLCKGNYECVRYHFVYYDSAIDAQRYLPADALVELQQLPPEKNLQNIAFQYAFYPIKISPEGDFMINLNGKIKPVPENWSFRKIGDRAYLYSKKGVDLSTPLREHRKYSQVRNVIIFLAIVFFTFMTGRWLLKVLRIYPWETGFVPHTGLSYLLGFLALSLSLNIALMFDPGFYWQKIVALWLAVAGGFYWAGSRIKQPQAPAPRPSEASTLFNGTVLGMVFVVIILYVFLTVIFPVSIWDEMRQWILKAKTYFHQERLEFSTGASNNYYPILWPIYIAANFMFVGGDYDEVAKWLSSLAFLAFLTQLKNALGALTVSRNTVNLMMIFFLVAFYHLYMLTALPENILIAVLTAALAAVLCWIKRKERKWLVLAVVLAIGLSAIKFEGFVVSVFFGLSLLAVNLKDGLKRMDYILIFSFFLAVCVPAGWAQWVKMQGVETFIYHLHHVASWANVVAVKEVLWGGIITDHKNLYLMFFLGVSMFLAGNKRSLNPQEKFLLFLTVGLSVFAVCAPLKWPTEHIYLYYTEVFYRLFLKAAPVVFLLWCSRIFRQGEQNE